MHDGVKFPCKHCSYQANTNRSLQIHQNSVYAGVKYPWKHCTNQTTTNRSFKEHQKSMHDGVKYKSDSSQLSIMSSQ